ncbi:MAG: type IV toxin-antitoxin system AbiEi family antitoxin domain-containing protein [Oryzihumus sp.]
MNDLLTARLEAQHGAITAADAEACGVSRKALARMVSRGALVRVHPGRFVESARLEGASPERQHALRTLAVVRGFADRHAASHVSALALHGLPVIGASHDRVHVTRTTPGRGRRTGDVVIHSLEGALPVRRIGGVLSVPLPLAVVQATASAGLVTGVAAADEALRKQRVTRQQLQEAFTASRVTHGVGDVRTMLEIADARSESPGESWTRVLFRAMGLPSPELQAPIADEDGWVFAEVDFLFRRQRTIVEFDGLLKYAGADGRRALVKEKQREDRLRSLGFAVVRLTWRDLSDPGRVNRLVRAAFARQGATVY